MLAECSDDLADLVRDVAHDGELLLASRAGPVLVAWSALSTWDPSMLRFVFSAWQPVSVFFAAALAVCGIAGFAVSQALLNEHADVWLQPPGLRREFAWQLAAVYACSIPLPWLLHWLEQKHLQPNLLKLVGVGLYANSWLLAMAAWRFASSMKAHWAVFSDHAVQARAAQLRTFGQPYVYRGGFATSVCSMGAASPAAVAKACAHLFWTSVLVWAVVLSLAAMDLVSEQAGPLKQ